ncbi:hypothetical protein LC728_16760 [Bacillus amyloliquefaciens]|uniref:hypothetical protein n=1 Tax=Bacillus amyloliquefaciens group TaxID=1938374 RepID=UPI001CD53B65|nr:MULTISPECIES: hypothetical protein [Bacillus amyloliquefaciens group]MCA1216016.1 hypothetical protein [Bacillus amyloliquefaciens]MCB7143853.1 hypothetical protein [Bacillus velezensis]MCC2532400.1 hypothetical protein [Bacillus velezensis]MCC2551268.1 hypothetical protein [Bacillus velezensis]
MVKKSFIVIEKPKGNITKLPYSPIKESLLLNLKTRNEKGEIELRCECSDKIVLKVSNAKSPYLYNSTRQFKHSKDCCRHPQFVGSSPYEKAWSYDEEEGLHIVRIKELHLSQLRDNNERNSNVRNNVIYHEGTGSNKNVSTIFGLATRINMMAWESMVLGKKHRVPNDKYELAKHVYGISARIRLSRKRKTLNEMFYKQVGIWNVKVKKDIYFVYMYVNSVIPLGEDTLFDNTKKDILYCEDAFGRTNRFYVEKEEYEHKKKIEPHSPEYVVAGFVYKEDKYHKCMTLKNYCLIPISGRGLYCESSHEKNIYDRLCEDNLTFYKPYLPIEGYGSFIPDGYVINKDKDIIFEVFGITGMSSYDERKAEKIALSQTDSFKSMYKFKYWEVN